MIDTQTRKAVKILERFHSDMGLYDMKSAKGIVILTQLKGAWFASGSLAAGIFLRRHENQQWSPPTAVGIGSFGLGFQWGGAYSHVIIILKTNKAVQQFQAHGQLRLGGECGMALGIAGAGAKASAGASSNGKLSSYSSYFVSKGAFIGMNMEGTCLVSLALDNYRYYGTRKASTSKVLGGEIPVPAGKKSRNVLRLHHSLISLTKNLGVHGNKNVLHDKLDALEEKERTDEERYSTEEKAFEPAPSISFIL